MSDYVTVTIPEALVQRAKTLARARQQPIEVVIVELLDAALPPANVLSGPIADEDAAVAREMESYIRLHPTLKADYLGQHVAILDGQLIDHGADPAALYQRIAARYPDRFVWITPVEQEPLATLIFRSPRVDA